MHSLGNIEKAIRANFILNPDGHKFLEADIKYEKDMASAARIVFVGIAVSAGHKRRDICEYIDMTPYEFNSKQAKFKQHYADGAEKMKAGGVKAYDDALDPDLRIYRKANLIKNYLNNLSRQGIYL